MPLYLCALREFGHVFACLCWFSALALARFLGYRSPALLLKFVPRQIVRTCVSGSWFCSSFFFFCMHRLFPFPCRAIPFSCSTLLLFLARLPLWEAPEIVACLSYCSRMKKSFWQRWRRRCWWFWGGGCCWEGMAYENEGYHASQEKLGWVVGRGWLGAERKGRVAKVSASETKTPRRRWKREKKPFGGTLSRSKQM